MFQITEESLQRFLETTKSVHTRLFNSPFWNLLKDEPFIMNWIRATEQVELQLQKQKGENEAAKI